jgi:Succinylglutamate desuccinylase
VQISGPGIISFFAQMNSEHTKRIVLSCGVHGKETAPIEICDDIVKCILTGTLVLSHDVLFLFGNLPAMDIAERFVEENMNRLFSGAHSKGEGLVNQERVRGKQLEEAVVSFFEAADGERYH